MKKENHDFEIRASRALGFGGSDAAMVLAIGKRFADGQPLTTTMKRRLRIAKGIDPIPASFTTEDIEKGHAFEDEVAKKFWYPKRTEREYVMESDKVYKFKVFAHADFFDTVTNVVTECKWTRSLTFEEVKQRYMPQIQWYYMLGALNVYLRVRVEDSTGIDDKTFQISRDDTIVEALEWSLDMLDEMWDMLDLRITEAGGSSLSPEVASAIRECKVAKESIELMQKRFDEQAAIVREWMSANGISKISSDNATVTYTPAGSGSRFDSAGLKKAYPKIWEMFNKKSERKDYITFKIKGNDNE